MSTTARLCLLFSACFVVAPCWAQNDPFGDPAGLFSDQPAKEEAKEVPEQDRLTTQWMEHSRRGDAPLADAIDALARLERWYNVDALLGRVAGQNLSQPALAEMARRIGPAMFLRMKQQEAIGDSAKAGIDKMISAAKALAESPERLQKAIDALDSSSRDDQLAAARTLLAGGNPAIAELVAAAVSETPTAPRDEILRAILHLGSGGVQALRQLALYGTPQVRVRAIEALARINAKANVVEFVTSQHAGDASQPEADAAKRALLRVGGSLPDIASAREILLIDFKQKQNAAALVDNDDQDEMLWSVNAEQTGVQFQLTQRMLFVFRDVADAASRLRRVGGLSPDVASDVLAARAGYLLMVDPDWGDPDQVEAARQQIPALQQTHSLSLAIQHALDTENHAAVLGLVRVIDPATTSQTDRDILLTASGATPTPLVQAASSPEPRVRYEAALAIANLADGRAYAGSSYVMHTLSEMDSLSDKPKAILVETRPDVIIRIESILRAIGFEIEVVHTVATLQRCVDQGGDLRMVVAKTQLADLPPVELIDLVRRLSRGREVPIVFYGSDAPDSGAYRWQAPVIWIDQPASTAGLEDLRNQVSRRRRLPPMTYVDRQRFRDAAHQIFKLKKATHSH